MNTNNQLLGSEFWRTANRNDVIEAIKNGADVRSYDENGATPLHKVVIHGKDPEFIDLLIMAGADIEARDMGGYTPLLAVAEFHSVNTPAMIEKLLDHGADINVGSSRGPSDSVMFYARTNSSLERSNALRRLEDLARQRGLR